MRAAIVGLGILIVVGIIVVLSIVTMNSYLHSPANIPEEGASFEIAPGSSFQAVANSLAEQGIIDRPDWLRWYARFSGEAGNIHAGYYRLVAGDTPASLLEKFVGGSVELLSFTIVPGWNYWELLAAMQASELIESTIDVEDWPAIHESFGATEEYPEGLFLPETYSFPRGTTDVDLLTQAYAHLQEVLAEEWPEREEGLPIASPYEALILASIIEKETARADERARIAGVFVRRLDKKMRLQTDPTVIYGIGPEFNGNITRKDLRTDTPYNTYTRHGLPPTPIAMAGREAIHAALHPEDGNELYFVATGLGDGSHKFSETKEEHDKAVQEYLARLRSNRNKSE